MKLVIFKRLIIPVYLTTAFFGCSLFYIQPDTKIVFATQSPDGKWIAEEYIELYSTFGGANYSVIIRPRSRWLINLEYETVFRIEDSLDSSDHFPYIGREHIH